MGLHAPSVRIVAGAGAWAVLDALGAIKTSIIVDSDALCRPQGLESSLAGVSAIRFRFIEMNILKCLRS
ncbi:unnamed protein product [Mycena citricolor]|uniref:Uncharacterized protein n=1 Tax=Mycena citricolor TaxID=2018698 RepID=A0AAD2Q5A3_9AGAR|nr:unnamed protein product [Mycena citricolor]